MNKTILILAAGSISQKFRDIVPLYESPVLLPVNSKTLGKYILDFYTTETDINLVINEKDYQEVYEELICTNPHNNVRLIGIKDSLNVIDSIRKSISQILLNEYVIINVITTIPTELVENDTIYFEDIQRTNLNWSAISTNSSAVEYVKKGDIREALHAFQGLFSVSSNRLKEALEVVYSNDLLDLVIHLNQNGWDSKIQFSKWIDCGHEENYFEAKNSLINSRAFNRLFVDKDIITKSSTHKEKIESEIFYYSNLPVSIAKYFPKLISNNSEANVPNYQLEFYNYPNLAELILYREVAEENFQLIFDQLEEILFQFKKTKFDYDLTAYKQFYLDKTKSRVASYRQQLKDNELKNVLSDTKIVINNLTYLNIDQLYGRIEQKIEMLYTETNLGIVHGDLCFNNILVNTTDYTMKLIDPRGTFHTQDPTIYGDLAYDLAKLAHSSIFNYDFLISDLFTLNYSKSHGFEYSIATRSNGEQLEKQTLKLINSLGYDFKVIKMIVGMLFISMTPLHNDSERRQLMMYLHGIKILNEAINE